jgi:hypothetical protein
LVSLLNEKDSVCILGLLFVWLLSQWNQVLLLFAAITIKVRAIRNPWITLIIVIELMACLGALGALVQLVFGAYVAGDRVHRLSLHPA